MTLTDLPNIGPVLAQHLKQVGITTPASLESVGAKEAFLRIRTHVDSSACLHELSALEGAVHDIPKKHLPPEIKQDLRDFYAGL